MPSWLIWTAVVCAAFVVGFFLGAICMSDSALGDAKRENDDEGWHD